MLFLFLLALAPCHHLSAEYQGGNEMERTLVIFKPDAVEQGRVGAILARFEAARLRIAGAKVLRLKEEILREHYSHLVDEPFFGNIVAYMSSTAVLLVVLEGENAVIRVREMVGPTDSTVAPKGTIRGDFGESKSRNMVHASEDVPAAAVEIARFFSPAELF
ncbi:MAG: nucleoside-diphosphate kinase [Puniceicoccales bacterium]|nr:nucleoside-diphosphate kinase [Puniceicoccales bacterium]